MTSAQLNIALLAKALPCHQAGGLEFHVLDLARGLNARGYRTTIITSAPPLSPCLNIDVSDLNIKYAATGAPGRYSRIYFKETQHLLETLHAAEPFALVHAQEFAAFYWRQNPRLPLVTTIHGVLYSETPLARPIFRQGTLAQKIAWLWRFKHRILMRGHYRRLLIASDRLIVDSEFTKGELLRDRVPEAKITLAPLGVNDSEFAPLGAVEARKRLGRMRPYLLTVSRLTWVKGIQTGIEAFAQSGVDLDYIIIGDGPEREKLKRLAERYPQLNIEFLATVSTDQLPLYYSGAELVLMPEYSQPAFGLVALEANLAGAPVLATRTGALPEVVGQAGGWLFERGDVDECAKQLKQLLSDPKALQAKGKQASAAARQRFSIEKMIDQVEDAYRACLA